MAIQIRLAAESDAAAVADIYRPVVAETAISFETVLAYTWVHGLVFCAIGGIASKLLGLAERDVNAGFGILLLFVIFEFGFVGAALVFAEPLLHALTWPSVLVGNIFATAVMAVYFRHRHAALTISP